ncbi:hypothetical protein MNBD_GAMMA09-794 [hydrothermal vent metagenome]|uniref:Uncharacterized protein n=1 Tax=hydrothermal vent metagenome TaxID=652676 RepID=A0A3B0Y962_9ZZZZ
MQTNPVYIKKVVLSLLLTLIAFLPHNSWLNDMAEDYTEQGIERTLITFAISRSLNGIISVAQGTELSVSPVGVGLTFTPGQILDPVNDLIERFSWVVLLSSTSLGIQRLFIEITSVSIVSWAISLLSIIFIFLLWFNKMTDSHALNAMAAIKKLLFLLLLLRFSIPLIAVINEGLYLSFLQSKYETSQLQLKSASDQIQLISAPAHENTETDSLIKKAEHWLDKANQSLDIERQMHLLKQTVADLSQQVINMIVVFVVQSVIFPLFFLWLIILGGKSLMRQLVS